MTAFPVYYINVMPVSAQASFGVLDKLGLGLWITGFAFESIADIQKLIWQERLGPEKRKTSFINEGLWTLSRHPNYFGEITLWIGNWIMCASAFRNSGWMGLGAISLMATSPIFVASLLCGLSGIPILEKSSDKKFGHLKEYQEYKRDVPELIPRIPFISTQKSIKSE